MIWLYLFLTIGFCVIGFIASYLLSERHSNKSVPNLSKGNNSQHSKHNQAPSVPPQVAAVGILKEMLKRMNTQLIETQNYLATMGNARGRNHYVNYLRFLEWNIRKCDKFRPNHFIEAMAEILKLAKVSRTEYIVAQMDQKVEFSLGEAEAYRFVIQTMANVIEYAPLYSTDGPNTNPFKGRESQMENLTSEFYQSPFSYDHYQSYLDNFRMLSMRNAYCFKRKDRSVLQRGQKIPWK